MRLVGREGDALALTRTLEAGAQVTTVWGPPGVGKSRLVRETLADAPVATLVTCHGVDDVLRALSVALGLESANATGIARAISKTPRLVLDACDPARSALAELVPRWERAQLVLTARGPLEIGAEQTLELTPLDSDNAIALWAGACRELGHAHDETLAKEIVDLLDRLPQAIEWLAGRAALLGDEACLSRLKARTLDSPLEAALDESLEALDGEARRALEALAAFEDGAPAVVLERVAPLAVIDVLTKRSLVRLERAPGVPTRLRPYRAVVSHMRARCEADGTWPARMRVHAEMVLQYAEPLADDLLASRAALSAERAELDAIAARFGDEDPALAARALVLVTPLALTDGTLERTAEALERLTIVGDEALDSRVHLALARMARRRGNFGDARAHLDDVGDALALSARLERAHLDRQQSRSAEALDGYTSALALARQSGDQRAECTALGEVGRMLQSLGRLDEARETHARAIALATKLGLAHREALERSLHARATHRLGEVREAMALHERALSLHDSLGDARLAAAERGHLGFCHHEAGAFEEAERSYRASIDGLALAGDVALEQIERVLLARLLGDLGRYEEARLELHIARELADSLDMPRAWLTWHLVAGCVEHLATNVEEARATWASGLDSGVLTEVGFEALLPAHLALVGDVRPDALRDAEAIIDGLGQPGTALAWRILRAAAGGVALPDIPEAAAATSSDVRRAQRLVGGETSKSELEVAEDGRFFRYRGEMADLTRRSAPRRLLAALAKARRDGPGEALSRDFLIEAGWPGERMRADAADKRLRTAIWTLRKAGLEGVLLTRDEGYLLDPFVPFTGA